MNSLTPVLDMANGHSSPNVVVFDVSDTDSLSVLRSALTAERRVLSDELALLPVGAEDDYHQELTKRFSVADALVVSLLTQTSSAERGC